mmetsp:Transcript_12317/g.51547  ORF Transcript_12317/g.51547 Transcript_12317/m.51547 type:complete len:328 (-) Transcript_12317:3149-4132(-)
MSAEDTADAGARLAPTTHAALASAGKSRPATCSTFPPHASQGTTLASDGGGALDGRVSPAAASADAAGSSSGSKRNARATRAPSAGSKGSKLASLQLRVTANGTVAGACAGTTHRRTRESPSKPADAATGPIAPKRHPARASAAATPSLQRQLAWTFDTTPPHAPPESGDGSSTTQSGMSRNAPNVVVAERIESTRPRSTTSAPSVFAATGTSHFTTTLDTPWPAAVHKRSGAAHAWEANTHAGESPSGTDVRTSSDAPRGRIEGEVFGAANAKLSGDVASAAPAATIDGSRYANGADVPMRIFGALTPTMPGLCAGATHSMPSSVR